MGLLSNIAAETLKSTGAGMSKTLREQAQEARQNALLNKKMQHDKDIAQTNRDARIESEVLQDHLAKGRFQIERDADKGRYTQGKDENGLFQKDTHTGGKDYYGSKSSSQDRYHFAKVTGPDGSEQVQAFDKQTGKPVNTGPGAADLSTVMKQLIASRKDDGGSSTEVSVASAKASTSPVSTADPAPKKGLLPAAQAIPTPDQRNSFNQAESAAIRYMRTDESVRDYQELKQARAALQQIAQTTTFPQWRERALELLNQLN